MKNRLLSFLISTCLAIAFSFVNANELPDELNAPGGVVIIPINSKDRPKAFFYDKRVLVIGESQNWKAIIGIPLKIELGEHKLKVVSNGVEANYLFEVVGKAYEAQYLTIKNKRQVNPNKEDMLRITRERKLISKAKINWREIDNVPLRFIKPAKGPFSSSFGLRRFFNNQPRNPHSGLDIAAETGTPIVAPAAGIVTNAGDYFFNGKTVFLDHGQGLITMYCHMENISVEEGDIVDVNDLLGTIGSTGRVTGAHLHWSVILNNTTVEPLLFLKAE
ncbi:MAG: peptidase M23 [Legionellales bacterium]|jgi:murein DD-endopeptidase MepM/ murein hydrolase activator NlpD|nr:peptidase M23 [Legionellales bacterium]HBH10527.1 peptidase M23 [Gammaproteobacteria bacterium]|tara:strand:- start:524 stop:1351 length:828 start_codon:yes stop_codon:yes gene_type:complete